MGITDPRQVQVGHTSYLGMYVCMYVLGPKLLGQHDACRCKVMVELMNGQKRQQQEEDNC